MAKIEGRTIPDVITNGYKKRKKENINNQDIFVREMGTF